MSTETEEKKKVNVNVEGEPLSIDEQVAQFRSFLEREPAGTQIVHMIVLLSDNSIGQTTKADSPASAATLLQICLEHYVAQMSAVDQVAKVLEMLGTKTPGTEAVN